MNTEQKPSCRRDETDTVLHVVEEAIALVFDTEQPKHPKEKESKCRRSISS